MHRLRRHQEAPLQGIEGIGRYTVVIFDRAFSFLAAISGRSMWKTKGCLLLEDGSTRASSLGVHLGFTSQIGTYLLEQLARSWREKESVKAHSVLYHSGVEY